MPNFDDREQHDQNIPDLLSDSSLTGPSLTEPAWVLDSVQATNTIAMGLDYGFLKTARFFCETREIVFIHADECAPTQKFDIPDVVFRELLRTFCARAEYQDDHKELRVSDITYQTSGGEERNISVYSDYNRLNLKSSQEGWSITEISLKQGSVQRSYPKDSELGHLEEVFQRIKASSNVTALYYQIEEQLQSPTSPNTEEAHLRIIDRNGSEQVFIEDFKTAEAAEETMEYLEQRLSGIGFHLNSYYKKEDPLSLPYWRLQIHRIAM